MGICPGVYVRWVFVLIPFSTENLATKEIQENLAIVFKEVVSVVNYIKCRPFNTRLFRALCDEMGAELSGLQFHSTVRWLSRGKVLERVATLREEAHV